MKFNAMQLLHCLLTNYRKNRTLERHTFFMTTLWPVKVFMAADSEVWWSGFRTVI